MKTGAQTPRSSRHERAYHHGDLASALLDAADAELRDKGIEGFSLRGVAKRAGVSHAAPAHHFKDVNGLLTALAARGFERFVARQADQRAQAGPSPRAQLAASGVGYVLFALENPALFRLMFGSDRPDFNAPVLQSAAGAAYQDLGSRVAAACDWPGRSGEGASGPDCNGFSEKDGDVAAAWAMAHGMADLLAAGRLKTLQSLPLEARLRALSQIMGRVMPATPE